MKQRPLIVFTVSWIAGSSAAYACSGSQLLLLFAGASLLLAALGMIERSFLRTVIIVWCALALSGAYWELQEAANVSKLPEALHAASAAQLDGSIVQMTGTVASAVEVDGDRADFVMSVRQAVPVSSTASGGGSNRLVGGTSAGRERTVSEKAMVQVKLKSRQEQEAARQWQRGDRVRISGSLEQPQTARNFGGFDYRHYLVTQKIHWLFKATGASNVQCSPPTGFGMALLLRWNDQARSSLSGMIDRIFKEPHAGYMKGLIIGLQDDLDPETYAQFSQLGLTHILAISGMHVAVYVGCLLYLFSLLRLSREKSLLLVMLLVPLYVLLSGVSPSVVRAGIMSMIGLYAARKGMLKDGLNILSAAALLMLLWNPYYLLSVSFQLSFLVTAGLMIYVPLIHPLLSFLPSKIAGAVGVTLIAQLVSFPLTIYYFNQFSLLSFAANFVLVPFITFLVLPVGTAALLIGSLWLSAGKLMAAAAEWLDDLSFWLVKWMNGYPQFVTIWKSPSAVWIASYFIALYGLLYFGRRWSLSRRQIAAEPDATVPLGVLPAARRTAAALPPRTKARLAAGALGALCVLIVLLYSGYQPERFHGAGAVQVLDVGQGDSILITTPQGKHLLVDGGGTVSFRKAEDGWKDRKQPFEVGAKVLVPLLKKRGIHELDAVIVSHGDQDHAGGMQAVLEQIPVRAFLFNGTLAGTAAFDRLMSTAVDKDIPIYAIHQGMDYDPDKRTHLAFLGPILSQDDQEALSVVKDQNHDSVVFLLEMNGGRFLFTGDMDKSSEGEILEAMNSGRLGKAVSENEQTGGHSAMQTTGEQLDAPVDVIKIAHHGSKTASSADWLNRWKPAAAVISAGVNNLYGHPHADVLQRISEEGAAVYRTDLQGEIQFSVKTGEIRVRTKLITKS
ncbi:DNA internalization-related competence protein ComEC/Rec2 [Paenibacillus sp. XY044]|uniref:DNA internalization-related competence protein ComEC/Rec2 n=1 Tax=Paenibacillus sp. XY044 TaxID=2026089 RepID=UPI000B99B6CC|nr:DNA internalization-related competence protein ComEC/Rec2 [Paenibacillus sp. XY044]OZB91634.1 DNA internalization-related competence protein ComEC/Rec2 [Paenibacillus sp. XY044]